MKTPKSLIRMAGKILRHLARFTRPVPDDLVEAVHALLDDGTLRAAWTRLNTAREHGWDQAAALVQPDLMYEAAQLTTRLERLLAYRDRPRPEPPALRTLIAELQQLEQEFDEVTILLRERQIVARTPAIELEDVYLGPFAIELHVDRLAGSPNPASCNESVTHPHVQDKALCAGDAAVPISQALKQGRIADGFCLVRSVLQTYNPASPSVALDSWSGQYCHDCDCPIDEDDARFCDHCDNRFCDGCMAGCDLCERSCCRGCIDHDPVSDRRCCPACCHRCSECDRVVDADSFNSETELCPECHEKRRQTNKE
ncbi:MAG: hypothetical protein ABSH20_32225, partial [Tepidisphaeraceae bacterium]